jgi:hypothetical protein
MLFLGLIEYVFFFDELVFSFFVFDLLGVHNGEPLYFLDGDYIINFLL